MKAVLTLALVGVTGFAPAAIAQSVMAGVALDSAAMTQADFARSDIEALIAKAAQTGNPVSLARARLNGLDLSGLDLTGADLRGARLNGADLSDAILDRAVLDQVWALDAKLDGASFQSASLFQTQLVGASLRDADFANARAPANFSKADLTNARFAGADLGADTQNQSMGLMRGDLSGATAPGADFTGANLLRVLLEFADLRGATFDDANLATALLAGADLTGASLKGTAFEGADLTSTRLIDLNGTHATTFEGAKNLDRAFRK